MNWIDKLERKFGRHGGIPNLTVYIIICYVIGYLLTYMNPSLLSMMSLDVSKILQGQIWRLVTWVIYPPSTGNFLLFAISILFFYYPIGTSLERTWGSFRYTLYIFSGLLFVFDRSVYHLFCDRWFCCDRWNDLYDRWKCFYDLLCQSFCISCLCGMLSGYADPSVVCDPDQNEMDGMGIWRDHCL